MPDEFFLNKHNYKTNINDAGLTVICTAEDPPAEESSLREHQLFVFDTLCCDITEKKNSPAALLMRLEK